MTDTSTTFQAYKTRLEAPDGSVALLGNLCFYSVRSDLRVTHADFMNKLTVCGLDDVAPKIPRDDDVFRRVCTEAQRKRVPTDDPEIYENYLIRDVKRSNKVVYKQIVVEQVNAVNKRLGYEPIIELKFELGLITPTQLSGIVSPEMWDLANHIISEYHTLRGCLNDYAVRETMRRVLLNADATVVRDGGGVYFVSAAKSEAVANLEDLALMMDGVQIGVIPLIDDERQRAMIKEAFENDTVGAIDSTLDAIDKMMKGPEITQKAYAKLFQEQQDLARKTKEYAEILDAELSTANVRLAAHSNALRRLLDHVKI